MLLDRNWGRPPGRWAPSSRSDHDATRYAKSTYMVDYLMTLDFDKAKLWLTTEQYRWTAQRPGPTGGTAGLTSLYNQLAAEDEDDFITPMDRFTTTGSSLWKFYSAVGDFLPAGRIYLVPYTTIAQKETPPLAASPTGSLPAPVPGGASFSPPPQAIGPGPLVPIRGGGLQVWQVVWQVIRASLAGSSTGFRGIAGTMLARVASIIGGITVLDWLTDQFNVPDSQAELGEKFIECLSAMEAEGMIHPYTPSRRFAQQGMVDPGPVYFIFNMERMQGNWTNFHMSRAGLRAHDDKQDTYKRPRRAARRTRTPAK